MATIQHPSMKRRDSAAPVAQQATRVTTVMPPEDEANMYEEDEELEELVSQQAVTPEQVMDDPVIENELRKKRTLEKLLLFKKPVYKEVQISDMTFRLKILTPQENKKVFSHIIALDEQSQIAETPNMILAASLVDVDGLKVEDTYDGDESIKDPILRKFYTLQTWPQPLIKVLNRAYNEFVGEKEKEFGADFLDKSQKTGTTG